MICKKRHCEKSRMCECESTSDETAVMKYLRQALIVAAAVAIPSFATAEPAAIRCAPDTAKVNAVETFSVDVTIDQNAVALHCFNITVDYDKTLIRLVSVQEGPLFAGSETFFYWGESGGVLEIGDCFLGYQVHANGPGTIARLTFESKSVLGAGNINVTVLDFQDTASAPIPTVIDAGTVIVGQFPGNIVCDPDSLSLDRPEPFAIDITIDRKVKALHCFNISVSFDRAVVKLVDVEEGPLFSDAGETTFFFSDSTAGGVDIGDCFLGYGLHANGPGTVARLLFEAQPVAGQTDITIEVRDCSDTALALIDVVPTNGYVQVGATCCVGRVGDANGEGGDEPTIGDINALISAIYTDQLPDAIDDCFLEADVNQSGSVAPAYPDDFTITDINLLIEYLYIKGPYDPNFNPGGLQLHDCF